MVVGTAGGGTVSGGPTGTTTYDTWLPCGTLTVANQNALAYSTVNFPNGAGSTITGLYYKNQAGGGTTTGNDYLVIDPAAGTNFTFGGITGTNSFALTNSANKRLPLPSATTTRTRPITAFCTIMAKAPRCIKVGTGMETLATWTNAYGSNSAGGGLNGNTVSMTVYGTQTNNWTGGTIIDAGTLQIANYTGHQLPAVCRCPAITGPVGATRFTTPISGSITGNVTDNGTLAFNLSAADMTYGGNISGSGGLVKTGSGTLTLTGTNNYTGTTFIGPFGGSTNIGGGTTTGGVLDVPTDSSLPSWNVPGMVHVSSGSTLAVGDAWTDSDVATLSHLGPRRPLGL